MLFDVNNLFWHTGSAFAFTAGEFTSLVGVATTTQSPVINMGTRQDWGIGDGEFVPKLMIVLGTGITSASASMLLNMQFQGSTNSTTWTTYAETGTASTASYVAATTSFNQANFILPIDLPPRPSGLVTSMPQFYRLQLATSATDGTATISAGTILAGIVIQRDDATQTMGQYPANFSVA